MLQVSDGTVPIAEAPAFVQSPNETLDMAYCTSKVQDQLKHAHTLFAAGILAQEGKPGGYQLGDAKFTCENGNLIARLGVNYPRVFDRTSAFCSCLNPLKPNKQNGGTPDDCIKRQLDALAASAHFATLSAAEGPLECQAGDLVRSAGGDYRVVEARSPFCACQPNHCDPDRLDSCPLPSLCRLGVCAPPSAPCGRGCVEGGLKALETEVKTQVNECLRPPCGARQLIHVQLSGDDQTGTGSSLAPYATVHKAFAQVRSPARILLGAGRFFLPEARWLDLDVEILGEGSDKTLLRVELGNAVRNDKPVFEARDSRVLVRDLEIDSLTQLPPRGSKAYPSLTKISFLFRFYHSRVRFERVSMKNLDSNQYFGFFNSDFWLSDIGIGEPFKGYGWTGDLGLDIIGGRGIVEQLEVRNSPGPTGAPVGANIDHIIDVHGLSTKPTLYVEAKYVKSVMPARLIVRDSYFMGRLTRYGEVIRVLPGGGGNEYYLYNNTLTKHPQWDTSSNGVCAGLRLRPRHNDILLFRNNEVSRHCNGVQIQGNPFEWTGALLFEKNRIKDNLHLGLEVGDSNEVVRHRTGVETFPFLDFGGGSMGSVGENLFIDNGEYEIKHWLESPLYVRDNYWGLNHNMGVRVKKMHGTAQLATGNIRDRWGAIILPRIGPASPW